MSGKMVIYHLLPSRLPVDIQLLFVCTVLLLLYISDTLASQWHGEHALPDACACKMTYHCRSGMIEFIFVILFFVVCNAKSCQRLLLVSLNYKRKLEIKCFMGIMTCSKKQRSLCKS